MNLFVAVIPKDKNLLVQFKDALPRIVTATVPFAHLTHTSDIWNTETVLAAAFSFYANVTTIKSYTAFNENQFFTFNGVPKLLDAGGKSWGSTLLERLTSRRLDPIDLGGYYNLMLVNDDTVSAWTCLSRIEPVYWMETPECFVVGNRAMLVYGLAHRTTNFEYDENALITMITAGWMVHDLTSFKGVRVLPNGYQINVTPSGARIAAYKPYRFEEIVDISKQQEDRIYDRICEEMLATTRLVGNFMPKVQVNLSGGKDSRIMVALCAKAGVPFFCVTSGSPEDREVVVAAEVAKILNVEHRTSARTSGTEVPRIDIFDMLERHIIQGEGMVNLFDTIYPVQYPNAMLSGHGGECLRGGYERIGTRPVLENREMALNFLQHLNLHNQLAFLKPEAMETQRKINEDIFDQFVNWEFPITHFYDYIYNVYREGRGIGNIRQASAYGAYALTPYLDDIILRLAWRLPIQHRIKDLLYYNILIRLYPELAYHRFSDSRWKFEEHAPGPETSQEDWLRRAPLPPSPPIMGAHHWRIGYDDYMRRYVRDYLLQSRSSSIYNIVDYNKVETVLAQAPPTPYGIMQSIYGILTMAYFLNSEWCRGTQ